MLPNADRLGSQAISHSHAPIGGIATRGTETSFDHPSSRRQHKASFRRWEFDDFEFDPMFFRCISCVFACVTLINIGDLDCFASLGLHSLGKFGDLGSILLIGWSHAQSEKMSQGVDRCMDFIAFAAFRSILPSAGAALHT